MFRFRNAKALSSYHLRSIGDNLLREEDQAELNSINGLSPGDELVKAVRENRDGCWLAWNRNTGHIAAVFGKDKQDAVSGRIIWMVGTPELTNCVPQFLRDSRKILDCWLRKYGTLHNVIDIRNKSHIDWLIWLGFTLPPDRTVEMHDGVPFQYFYKEI